MTFKAVNKGICDHSVDAYIDNKGDSPGQSLPPLLSVKKILLRFDDNIILNNISCDFYSGNLVSLVGPNGAGKTSFFNLLSGHLRPQLGQIIFRQQDITKLHVHQRVKIGLGRSFQINQLFPNLTVLDNVSLSVTARYNQGHVFWRQAKKENKIKDLAWTYLESTNLTTLADSKVTDLSHGEQRKLELALLLALDAEVLLLDEPTAGLGVDELADILGLIQGIKSSNNKLILLIEHKLEAVKQLSDRIIVLNNAKLIADGKPEEVMSNPMVQKAYFGGL